MKFQEVFDTYIYFSPSALSHPLDRIFINLEQITLHFLVNKTPFPWHKPEAKEKTFPSIISKILGVNINSQDNHRIIEN